MPRTAAVTPDQFTTFGEVLKFLRRRAGLNQRELSIAVGYSESQVSRLELNQRPPDMASLSARFVPALGLEAEREWVARLLELAAAARVDGEPDVQRQNIGPAPLHNLPTQLTSFIGREREIGDVKRLLSTQRETPAGVRLLTLTGPGGSGKTRLCLQAAGGLLDALAFPDGVWLVELAPLADPTLVAQTVATVLGVRELPGRPITAVLVEHLRPKQLLLVLDNCEHLVQACAELADQLLRACPQLKILATSREGLSIAGESVYPVPPLTLPDPNHLEPVAALTQFEAVRLFVERAQAVLPGFAVTSANARAVARVCQQLDGIPLAIELAAARMKVLRVEEIAARLGDRFRLLTGGSRVALPRHQTLQALIDWSYDLLSVSEKRLLERLAVFVGGWTLEAAEVACAGEGVALDDVLDLLTQLANKSLVVIESGPESAPRYHLLETVRQYALGRLTASDEMDNVWRRLAKYYIGLAKTPGSDAVSEITLAYNVSEITFAYNHRLDPERDNLRAALAWTRSATGTAELGLRLAEAVMAVWISRGHFGEGRGILEGALAAAALEGAGDAQARARALYGLGFVEFSMGDYVIASTHLRHSLSLSQELNERLMSGWTLNLLGELALEQGDTTSAHFLAEESLAPFRELDNNQGVAFALFVLGQVAVQEEDASRATALLHEGLALGRALKDGWVTGWILTTLGLAAQLQGNYDSARQLHQESLASFRELGEPNFGAPWALQGMGETELAQGNTSLATAHFKQALNLFRDEGDRGGVSFCLAGLAGTAVLEEVPERAAQLWGAAEALRQSIGTRHAPATRATRERLMAAARDQLGDDAFAAAWTAGQAMTPEQAIDYALEHAT